MRRIWILGLFLVMLGFYVGGLAPSVSVGDSGEFATASAVLAVPHPPGYPAYTLLSRVVTTAVPLANPAYQTNLFSALCGATAVTLLAWMLMRQGIPFIGALLGALLFGFSTALVINSRHTEVFALHGLLSVAILTAALSRRWALAGLLFGVGLSNHQTLLLLAPALMLLIRREERVRALGMAMAGAALGLLLYAFLYKRASQGPFLNVGDPDTLQKLWRVMRRADYGTLVLATGDVPPRTLSAMGLHLLRFGQGWLEQIGILGICVTFVGAGGWWMRQRQVAAALILGWVLTGPFFFWLGNLPFNAQSIGLLERFHILPTLLSVILSAGVLLLLGTWAGGSLLVLALGALLAHGDVHSARAELQAYSYGRNTLRSLPAGSTLMMDGGDDTFYTLAYLTQAEGRRRDVTLHDRGGVVFAHPYGDDFRRLPREAKEDRRRQVETALVTSGQPLYYATMNEKILPGAAMLQEGLVYRALPGSAGKDRPELWALYDLRGVAPWMDSSRFRHADYRTRALLPYYSFQRATSLGRSHLTKDAVGFLRSAYAQGPDVLWLRPNLVATLHYWGYRAYFSGSKKESMEYYEWILRLDPSDATAKKNLNLMINELPPPGRA